MHGNVWEWCNDNIETQEGTRRPFIGGSWNTLSQSCRPSFNVAWVHTSYAFDVGLRLARVPLGAPSPEVKPPPLAVAPFTDADVKRIAALPAKEQVEEVRKELMRRNPGFDGTIQHNIDGGVVTEFKIVTDQVNGQLADPSPLAGMNLAGLTRLDLSFTKVGDAGLVHFKDCTNLMYLGLDSTQVTDAGLAYFKNCTNLTHLHLGRTKVNSAGLAHFENCKKLIRLDLSEVSVNDAGLASFKECKDLIVLGLGRTLVSDAGVSHFKDCKKLKHLNLANTRVGDVGLAHFKDCKELIRLHIGGTKVTDLSLIKDLPLKELDFDFRPERDAEILRSIKSLETINGKRAVEFWTEFDGQ